MVLLVALAKLQSIRLYLLDLPCGLLQAVQDDIQVSEVGQRAWGCPSLPHTHIYTPKGDTLFFSGCFLQRCHSLVHKKQETLRFLSYFLQEINIFDTEIPAKKQELLQKAGKSGIPISNRW